MSCLNEVVQSTGSYNLKHGELIARVSRLQVRTAARAPSSNMSRQPCPRNQRVAAATTKTLTATPAVAGRESTGPVRPPYFT